MVVLVVLLVTLSCYVGCSNMPNEVKTPYFVAVAILVGLILLFKLI